MSTWSLNRALYLIHICYLVKNIHSDELCSKWFSLGNEQNRDIEIRIETQSDRFTSPPQEDLSSTPVIGGFVLLSL